VQGGLGYLRRRRL